MSFCPSDGQQVYVSVCLSVVNYVQISVCFLPGSFVCLSVCLFVSLCLLPSTSFLSSSSFPNPRYSWWYGGKTVVARLSFSLFSKPSVDLLNCLFVCDVVLISQSIVYQSIPVRVSTSLNPSIGMLLTMITIPLVWLVITISLYIASVTKRSDLVTTCTQEELVFRYWGQIP